MKSTCVAMLVVLASIAAEGEALACRCIGSRTSFEQAVAEAPVVLVGRVLSIGSFRVPTRGGFDPPVVQLEVISGAKGALDRTRERVDVWNPAAGSSCGGTLRSIDVGSHVVFALRQAQSGHVAPESVMRRTGVARSGGGCADPCGRLVRDRSQVPSRAARSRPLGGSAYQLRVTTPHGLNRRSI